MGKDLFDKFLIWGAGERGKIIAECIGQDRVVAYIDKDETKQGGTYLGYPIISLEEYQEKYSAYFIIVTPIYNEEIIVNELHEHNIKSFFLMSLLPSEMQGYGDKNFLNKIEIPVTKKGNNIIWGTTLYSCLLYEKIVEMGYDNIFLYEEAENELVNVIKEKLHCRFISQIDAERDNIILTTAEERVLQQYKNCAVDLFDVSDLLPQYFNKSILDFRNIHRGERCFIVATGPSLTEEDLRVLAEHQEICFGVNRIFNVDEKLWRPQYYIFLDRAGMTQYWDRIAAYGVEEKFLGDAYWKDTEYKGNMHVIHTLTVHSFNELPRFSEHIERKVYSYSTVTYAAIQLAVYMGFSTIFLLGVDCNYSKNSKNNYFFEDKKADNLNHNEERMVVAYKTARKYADSHGVKIFNASRGGMLEEFERVCFDDLFNGKEC